MADGDQFKLQRFVDAQNDGGVYAQALAELHAGAKRGHWIWFVFPQIAGLGSSQTARFYAISSLDEAQAYRRHPVLGPRLIEAAEALLALQTGDPVAVLGEIDALKLRSSMTLFAHAGGATQAFTEVLERFYGGEQDAATERLL
jgi:uncharacterized protein (DUF1810 family)